MTDEKSFLATIAENELDPGPHWVYADWLEEQGRCAEAQIERDWTAERLAARKWLKDFAASWRFDYDEMVSEGCLPPSRSRWGLEGGIVVADGIDLHGAGELGTEEALFWQNLEILTGKTFGREHREALSWSCSC